jgi:hypothetical protein
VTAVAPREVQDRGLVRRRLGRVRSRRQALWAGGYLGEMDLLGHHVVPSGLTDGLLVQLE